MCPDEAKSTTFDWYRALRVSRKSDRDVEANKMDGGPAKRWLGALTRHPRISSTVALGILLILILLIAVLSVNKPKNGDRDGSQN